MKKSNKSSRNTSRAKVFLSYPKEREFEIKNLEAEIKLNLTSPKIKQYVQNSWINEKNLMPGEPWSEKLKSITESMVFDVLLCYNKEDKVEVQQIADELRQRGLTPWLDEEKLKPGEPWYETIKDKISTVSAAVIFIGKSGLGPWRDSELKAILNTFGNEIHKFQIAALPDVPKIPLNLSVLNDIPFVDFRNFSSKPIEQLIRGVTANKVNNKQNKSNTSPLKTKKIIHLPDIDWVEIPAGNFKYGKSQQSIMLQRFFISKYPITNSQFQTFIDAGSYQDARWWQDLIMTAYSDSQWKQTNRPRVTVSWYEAVAFTQWLSIQLGFTITLPTEQQWEKAARGTEAIEYPWGNVYKTGDANVYVENNEQNLEQTCAVGLYMHRPSPYQIMDMAGNVWEWCLNKFKQPDSIKPDKSNNPRALRGGSWEENYLTARTYINRGRHPDLRDYDVGFRVVCTAHL